MGERKRKQSKRLPLLENVSISGVAAEGKAVARVNDWVVFVPFGAPGDVADIRLTCKKSNYAEGAIVRLQQPSPVRVTPFCSHFGVCGGCHWQHLPYEEQINYKEQQVADTLRRIGKVEIEETAPILACRQTQHYRNKLEFTFSNRKWLTEEQMRTEAAAGDRNALGFHIPGRFDKVLDLDACYLQNDISNRIRRAVRNYCLSHEGYEFFDLRRQVGFMRTLIIRTSSVGETMVIVVFFRDDAALRDALLQHIAETFPEINALLYVVNDKCNDSLSDREAQRFSGNDHIIERMEDLQFKIGAKSFFQTNSLQAYELYKVVRDFAALSGTETVYDLYSGTGTIAHFLARHAAKVVGIEYAPEAVADAQANAALNDIANARFFAGDLKNVLTEEFIRSEGRPDVIITDPPRAGMHKDVIAAILRTAPKRIVYVSCNPATQARDLTLLCADYRIAKIQPVDMFPHTHHVENIALLLPK